MKKSGLILGFLLLTTLVSAQVKQNEKGLYVDSDNTLFTGTITNKENGVKQSEIKIVLGLQEGQATYFYASGKIMETGSFEKGQKNGEWLRYNESGLTVGSAIYNLGKKNGTWIVWDDNGKKRFEMHYFKGEKTGTWYNWDEKGELISSKNFSQVN